MKKLSVSASITLSIGLAMIIVGAVLRSIWGLSAGAGSTFNAATLATAFESVGYVLAVISGVILAAYFIVGAVKGESTKKVTIATIVLLAVGLAMVVIGAVLGSVTSLGGVLSADKPFIATNISSALNTIGYLMAMLSGVVLAAVCVSGAFNKEK